MEDNPYWFWPQCDVEGCEGVSCSGGKHWGKEYWNLCPKHSAEKREGKPQPQMKQSAIDRENSRDEKGILPNKFRNPEASVATGSDSSNVADKLKYKSPYESVVTYKSDKNFDVRLKSLIDRKMNEAGYDVSEERFTKLLNSIIKVAEDYLFASKEKADQQKSDKEGIDVASDSKPDNQK